MKGAAAVKGFLLLLYMPVVATVEMWESRVFGGIPKRGGKPRAVQARFLPSWLQAFHGASFPRSAHFPSAQATGLRGVDLKLRRVRILPRSSSSLTYSVVSDQDVCAQPEVS